MGISGTGLRLTRAAVFTAICVVLSSGAHVLLSGSPVPAAAVAWVTAAVLALSFLLAGAEERCFRHIAALLVPLQLAADTLFTIGQTACYGPGGGPVTGPLRALGLDLVCSPGVSAPLARLAPGGEPVTAGGAHPAAPWLLLVCHVAVGLAAAAWLRCGEAGLARLLRAAVAATFRPLRPVGAVRPPVPGQTRTVPLPACRPRFIPVLEPPAHPVVRRGPPSPAPAA